MKTYKNNLVVQGFLLITLIALLIGSIFDRSFLVMVMVLQFFLGITQYFSAWFLKDTSPEDKFIRAYLKAASATIIACISLAAGTGKIEINYFLGLSIVVIIPWCLAFFYWYISFKNVKYLFFKKSIFQ